MSLDRLDIYKHNTSAAITEIRDFVKLANKHLDTRLASMLLDDGSNFHSGSVSTKDAEYVTFVHKYVPQEELNQDFFYYSLLGHSCNNNQCLKNTEVTLRFSIDKTSTSAGTIFGEKLKVLEYVDISVIAEGFTKSKDMQGQWVRRLWLSRNQNPNKPTTVDFKYIACNREQFDAGFYVRIDYRGRPVYHFWLAVSVVDKLDFSSVSEQAPLDLDLDKLEAARSRQPCDLTISLTKEGDRINIYAAKFVDGLSEVILHEDADMDVNRFMQIANNAKANIDAIANQAIWNQWSVSEPNNAFKEELIRISEVSNELCNSLIFKDEKFKTLVEAVEDLKPGSRITICTNTLGFPWDILSTRALVDDDILDVDRFWGVRYRIECLRNNRKTKPSDRAKPKATNSTSSSSLVCLIDNSIDEDHAQAVVDRLHPNVTPNVVQQCENKKSALKTVGPEKCVYILCHGAADQPLQSDGSLALDSGCRLSPMYLVDTDCYQNKPLIIINACSGTLISPFAATSFSEIFNLKNAQGVVGPLFLVPTNCATKMGIALLEGYLIKQDTIGDTLAAIRREWLVAYNPIPLFYQLQCNMDAKL